MAHSETTTSQLQTLQGSLLVSPDGSTRQAPATMSKKVKMTKGHST